MRIGLISAATYRYQDNPLRPGSNHGTAFASTFNGFDDSEVTRYEWTFGRCGGPRGRRRDESVERLNKGLAYLREARPRVLPGAREELHYLIFKTESYISHLEAIRFLLAGFIAYDRAFWAKLNRREKEMVDQFNRCQFFFSRARDQAQETAAQISNSRFVEDPTEKYILFRYNVRFLLPLEEFSKFIKNVVNFHHGQPYWEKVNWDVIAPRQWMNP